MTHVKMSKRLFCVCRQPDDNRFMVCCDGCEDWFHPPCIGLTEKFVKDIEHFLCSECELRNKRKGSPLMKEEVI